MNCLDRLQDPCEESVFRANMVAAIRRYGKNGLRVLQGGQEFCSGCGHILPTAVLQRVRREPVFCDCGRLVVSETDPLLPHFSVRFA